MYTCQVGNIGPNETVVVTLSTFAEIVLEDNESKSVIRFSLPVGLFSRYQMGKHVASTSPTTDIGAGIEVPVQVQVDIGMSTEISSIV